MSKKPNIVIVVNVKHPNPRAHFLLFKNNSPFRPKQQKNQVLYRRHNKHRKQIDL